MKSRDSEELQGTLIAPKLIRLREAQRQRVWEPKGSGQASDTGTGEKLNTSGAVQTPAAALWSRKHPCCPGAAHAPRGCRSSQHRWNCPGTANKRDSDPTQDYRKEYNATSCQTVLFPSPVPSPPSLSLIHGRDSSSQNPLSPRSLLAKRLHYKSREPLSPTYHPGFLTRWQERCFACTKIWHSKLLLKPISLG